MVYSVYILLCSDGSFYTGVTNDLKRRKQEHDDGINEGSYTSYRRPVEIVYIEENKYINNAIAREKQIKRWSRAKKIALIEHKKLELPGLSRKKKFSRNKI
ncbi:MAG: GIY-YIG nuclease family protein [Bacteroidota bacterium]|nr:GIY-YIG nuclease family protein [Bacteroidota bacterium]